MSHNSPRSRKTKTDARTRPDVMWHDAEGSHEEKLSKRTDTAIFTGGSELAQLISETDAHLVAMRKIVQ